MDSSIIYDDGSNERIIKIINNGNLIHYVFNRTHNNDNHIFNQQRHPTIHNEYDMGDNRYYRYNTMDIN